MNRFRRILLAITIIPAILYLSCLALIWWAMLQPPEKFGRIMAKMPQPVVFLLFPFETLWLHARAGGLKVGEAAPDFSLLKVDKSGTLRLAELNRQKPVVLVFGSYT